MDDYEDDDDAAAEEENRRIRRERAVAEAFIATDIIPFYMKTNENVIISKKNLDTKIFY